eukprot:UN32555
MDFNPLVWLFSLGLLVCVPIVLFTQHLSLSSDNKSNSTQGNGESLNEKTAGKNEKQMRWELIQKKKQEKIIAEKNEEERIKKRKMRQIENGKREKKRPPKRNLSL